MTARRAGARWRLLVHNIAANGRSGVARTVASHPSTHRRDAAGRELHAQHAITEIWPDTEMDELVVGRFLHVEQMDTGCWWINVAGLHVTVTADRDGRPRSVLAELAEPHDGVAYNIDGEPT